MKERAKAERVPYSASGLVDMHSHILPGMDDGARTAAVSLAMLDEMAKQGVFAVISTSHFYPENENPDAFLRRRAAAAEMLRTVYDPAKHPTLYVGAEVAYYPGISRSSELEKLRILGTRSILIEMPFFKWSQDMLRELVFLGVQTGLRPILAHMERCIPKQPRDTLQKLLEGGVRLQSNAEYFLNRKTSKEALRYLSKGYISFLGSDAHNTDTRAPNLQAAVDVIADALGEEAIRRLVDNGRVLTEEAIPLFETL